MNILVNVGLTFSLSLIFSWVLISWVLLFPQKDNLFQKSPNLNILTFGFVMSLAILDLLMYLFGFLGINLTSIVQYIFYLLVGISFYSAIRRPKINLRNIILLFTCTLIGIWNFLPALFVQFQSRAHIGMITKGNNDISNYVAIANEFLKSGFTNSMHLNGINLNLQAKENPYFGPDAILSFVAGAFHLEAWQATMPAAIVGLIFSALALGRLGQSIFPKLKLKQSLLIAATILFTPLICLISSQYFLGQIFSIAISASALANFIEFIWNGNRSIRIFVEIAGILILGIFTYPAFLVPFFCIGFLSVYFVKCVISKEFRVKNLSTYLASIILGCLFSCVYIPAAIAMSRNLEKGVFGWPFPPLNSLGVLVWPELLDFRLPRIWVIASWVAFFSVFVLFIVIAEFSKDMKFRLLNLSFLFIIFVLMYIQYKGEGYGAYHSWKLISYFEPILLIIFLGAVASSKLNNSLILGVTFGVTLMASISTWGLSSSGVGFTNSDFETLGSNRIVQSLKELNIDLDPYFETMAAAAIIHGPQLSIESPSYWGSITNPKACTLTHLTNPKYPIIYPLNATYGLAPFSQTNCGVNPIDINWNEVIWMDSKRSKHFWSGWNPPEAWGTLSATDAPQINLHLNHWNTGPATLTIRSKAFLAKNHDSLNCAIFVNGFLIKHINFQNVKESQNLILDIPAENIQKNRGNLYIQFRLETPKSPRELGISDDARKLGIGIEYFRIDHKK